MRGSFSLCCVVWLLAAGCQGNQTPNQASDQTAQQAPPDERPAVPAGVDPQYAAEIVDICFGQERSGALEHDEGQRAMIVAQWLGTRIRTQQGRDFLAAIARAEPAQKVAMLEAEARKVGSEDCPLTLSWGGPTP